MTKDDVGILKSVINEMERIKKLNYARGHALEIMERTVRERFDWSKNPDRCCLVSDRPNRKRQIR